MIEFKIEKNIPMPSRLGVLYKSKYPFFLMKKGDSFAFPKELKAKVAGSAYCVGKLTKYKMRFSVRKLRCWRIK